MIPRLWQEAASFAARAHRHQTRKDGTTPYAAHTTRVALIVALEFGCTDKTVIAAALLHDVLEDTTRDYDDLEAEFGPRVAAIVAHLSKDPRLPEPEREKGYDERLRAGPVEARLIKLADVYDNLTDADDEPARRRLLEKAERALALAAGDPELDKASGIVRALVAEARDRLAATG